VKCLPLFVLLLAGIADAQTTPLKALSFDSLPGVNFRMPQGDDTVTQVENFIYYTHILNFRNEATHAGTGQYQNFCAVANTVHAHPFMIGIVDDPQTPNPACVVSDSNPYCGNAADEIYALEQMHACGGRIAEPANEPNNESFTYTPGVTCNLPQGSGTWQGCGQEEADLESQVHADPNLAGEVVLAVSEAGAENDATGVNWLTPPVGTGTLFDGVKLADVANIHNYFDHYGIQDNAVFIDFTPSNYACIPNTAMCYDTVLGNFVGSTWGHSFAGPPIGTKLPLATTETGMQTVTGQYTQAQQGKYIMDAFLDGAANGWSLVTIYTGFDQTSDGSQYGLYLSDHATPKLSAFYVHNLLTITADKSSNFTPTPVSYSITGLPTTGHSLLMQKSPSATMNPSRHMLAVWGEANLSQTATPVTVNLGGTYSNVTVFRPTIGTSAIAAYASASTVPLTLVDEPYLIFF
jgi:hypothetical protein